MGPALTTAGFSDGYETIWVLDYSSWKIKEWLDDSIEDKRDLYLFYIYALNKVKNDATKNTILEHSNFTS